MRLTTKLAQVAALAAAATLAVACMVSCSSSKACDAGPGATGGAATCPSLQGATTFDEEVASLCSAPNGNPDWLVVDGTKECGGFLAVYEQHGIDTESIYLFDPTTRELVETLSGVNFDWTCTGVATQGCTPSSSATSCFSHDNPPQDPWGWGFQLACPATSDAGR